MMLRDDDARELCTFHEDFDSDGVEHMEDSG